MKKVFINVEDVRADTHLINVDHIVDINRNDRFTCIILSTSQTIYTREPMSVIIDKIDKINRG